jgi:Holliday junction resolvase
MPNRNYIKGVKKERAIVNEARDKGLIAFRSAGSHSPIDVCVIDKMNRTIMFIQCKPNSMSMLNKNRLEQQLKELNDMYHVSFNVV